MGTEQIFWHKGISKDARSGLQQPGYLGVAKNLDFTVEGKQTLRPPFIAINATALSSIHSLKVWRGMVIAGAGAYLYRGNATTTFASLGITSDGSPWTFKEYKDFLHAANGKDAVLIDEDGNCYPAAVDNPTTAPCLATSTGTGPNGNYFAYVSFYVTYPNGMTYETGLSPASSNQNVSDDYLEWSSIPVSTYAAYSGTAPTIERKLYRGPGTGGTLADIYYVQVIKDNTTTTYTDNNTDAELAANGACDVDDYGPPEGLKYIEYHYGRLNGIDAGYPHRLKYSEAAAGETSADNEVILPIAVPTDNYDDIRVSGLKQKVDPTGLVAWGTNLFIPLKHTWIRRQGNDPETWSYKKTYASFGIVAPYTMDVSNQPSGIIGLCMIDSLTPGIAIFNGQTSEILSSPKLDAFLTDIDLEFIHLAQGGISGKLYHLMYSSVASAAGVVDKHLVVDLRRSPDIRVGYWDGLNARCMAIDDDDKTLYIGGTDGIVYKMDSAATELRDVDVESHYLIGGQPQAANKKKAWKQLKYNLDTNGDSVTLEVYVDGTLKTWPDGETSQAISGTADEVQVLPLPQDFQGYQIKVRVYGSDLGQFDLYSPWDLDYDLTA